MGEWTKEAVIEAVQAAETTRVKVAITDIDGILRGKYIHKNKLLSALEGGFGFCNVVFGWDAADVCYDNSKYTGWHSGYPDAEARLALETFRRVPWDDEVPFMLADFVDADGSPLEICPRQTLKRVIAKAEARGFSPSVGCEFEWFNFKETPDSLHGREFKSPQPLTPGMFGYSLIRASQNRDYFVALMEELPDFGLPLEGLHTETGPGVFEAAILYSDALVAADRAVLFKAATKEIGQRFGIMPTFMAKISPELPGCSGHIHQSLWQDGKPLFFDESDPQKISKTFRHYLAGVMHCLPEVLPCYAPTINSYKRLVEGMWAPTKVTWGMDNRTTALRVLGGSAKSTRLELRVPGADMNPYLGVAATVASGLYGIENELELPPLTTGNGYAATGVEVLPANLQDAAKRMMDSKVANEILGETFVQHFGDTRLWEWRQFQTAVTSWETERYFEII
jgi:glutamine synthetase